MYTLKINILDAMKIRNTKKDFLLYDIDNNNKITRFKLTNDLKRYRKQYNHFKLTEILTVENTSTIVY